MKANSHKILFLEKEMPAEVLENSGIKEIPKGTEILREGQYVKVIPVVIEGLIKVFNIYEERDLLLYYIQPGESCIMSFSSVINDEPSRVYAVTEEDTRMLLMPVDKVLSWVRKYPELDRLFYKQYSVRYADLLNTISQVLFEKMDTRLLNYLKEKVELLKQNPLKISHREIANDLGTVREVISRVIKKLETDGKVKQLPHSIKITGV